MPNFLKKCYFSDSETMIWNLVCYKKIIMMYQSKIHFRSDFKSSAQQSAWTVKSSARCVPSVSIDFSSPTAVTKKKIWNGFLEGKKKLYKKVILRTWQLQFKRRYKCILCLCVLWNDLICAPWHMMIFSYCL